MHLAKSEENDHKNVYFPVLKLWLFSGEKFMIEIHIYGHFKKMFDPNASLAEDTIFKISHKKGESFYEFLRRIGLNYNQIGTGFINGKFAKKTSQIPKNARIGLFPASMRLIDGGLYIKFLGQET